MQEDWTISIKTIEKYAYNDFKEEDAANLCAALAKELPNIRSNDSEYDRKKAF